MVKKALDFKLRVKLALLRFARVAVPQALVLVPTLVSLTDAKWAPLWSLVGACLTGLDKFARESKWYS